MLFNKRIILDERTISLLSDLTHKNDNTLSPFRCQETTQDKALRIEALKVCIQNFVIYGTTNGLAALELLSERYESLRELDVDSRLEDMDLDIPRRCLVAFYEECRFEISVPKVGAVELIVLMPYSTGGGLNWSWCTLDQTYLVTNVDLDTIEEYPNLFEEPEYDEWMNTYTPIEFLDAEEMKELEELER